MPLGRPAGRASPFDAFTRNPSGTVEQEDIDEEAIRQERILLDTRYLPELHASGELHGFVYTMQPEVAATHPSINPQQQANPTSPRTQPFNIRSKSGASLDLEQPRDASETSRAASAANGANPSRSSSSFHADAFNASEDLSDPNGKVQELLAPMSAETSGQQPLVLGFRQLSVWAPLNPKKPNIATRAWKQCVSGGKAVTNPKRQILYDISGQIRPGEVLALMGPSGSGKTSLLTVLGGRSAMKFKGQVFVNNQPYSKATRRRIGFVLQDDVLYEALTVKETLTYAALLRLPAAMSGADKRGRVDAVIDALGLRKSKDTIIGGFFRRGISGGERKRVSIGHELLINPAILMLDEPTSGLDSTTAMHLLSLLQDLAAGGRSIATTIHQPSSRLYQKLDWLMLLAEGHMMYYGKADQVLDWFGQFGYKIPFGVSIADYILDISLGEAGYSSSGKTGSAAVTELYEAYESRFAGTDEHNQAKHSTGFSFQQQQQQQLPGSRHHRASDAAGTAAAAGQQRLPVSSSSVGGAGNGMLTPVAGSHASDDFGPPSGSADMIIHSGSSIGSNVKHGSTGGGAAGKGGSSGSGGSISSGKAAKREGAYYWDQLRVLTQRSGRVRRFEQMTGQHFFQLFAVAFITGLVWWQRGQDYYGGVQAAADVLGLLFFMLLFPSMRALFRALFTFPNEYRMLMKERPSGMYNLSAYYIARTAADIPAEMVNTLLFVIIAYWFGGLRHTAGAFFGLLFGLVLVTAVAESWGLLIGGVFMEPKTAQTVTTVVILAFLLVGGYYVRNIPVWIGWIRYLSFLYWGYNLLIKTQFSDVTYYTCQGEVCQPIPLDQLSLTTNPTDPAWPDVVILLAMLIVLRLCIYYVLRRKTRVKQRNVQ